MREEHLKLLSRLEKTGRPARVSELREGFRVNDRTLRRWLLALCDEGKVEAVGANKGRRYQVAVSQEPEQETRDGTLDALQQELLQEVIRDAAHGRTLTTLVTERIRAILPAPARRGFVDAVLQRLQTMTVREAEALRISPEVFKYWHRLQSCAENRDGRAARQPFPMTPRFLSIEHVPQEGIGTISTYLRNLGASLTRHRQYRRQPLATPHGDYDALVVMGGPMGVGDGGRHAWLDPELHFVREAVRRGKHVLGICLGAQMIAQALGAEVRKNPCTEIGWFPVTFEDAFLETRPGRGLDRQMDVLHWHGDTFAIPPGAVRVAGSEACANQGFLYGDRVLGLQFHLEMEDAEVAVMTGHFRDELAPGRFVQSAEAIRERTAECAAPARRALFSILDGWLARWAADSLMRNKKNAQPEPGVHS